MRRLLAALACLSAAFLLVPQPAFAHPEDEFCTPGGGMDPGESAEEACVREVWEETGLHVAVTRLIGIYTSPHRITLYADGNRFQFVSFCFEAQVTGGKLGLSDETVEAGYFTAQEIAALHLMENHVERVADALARQTAAFMR